MTKVLLTFSLAILISSVMYGTIAVHARIVDRSDVSLVLSASSSTVEVGGSVQYLYNASNTGDLPLTGSIIDDVFGPVGNFVDLAPGGWVAFLVSHVLSESTHNFATVTATDTLGGSVTDKDSTRVRVLVN